MANDERRETLTPASGKRRSAEIDDEEDDEEREIEELEREVKEMAEKIIESRRTIQIRISEAVSSQLIAQRPVIPQIGSNPSSSSLSDRNAQAGTSGDPSKELRADSELREGASLTEADPEILEKLRIFRAKAASNVAAMPVILKRMNDCIARLDRIEHYNVNIHSVFKKKRK